MLSDTSIPNSLQAAIRSHTVALLVSLVVLFTWTNVAVSKADSPSSLLSWNHRNTVHLTYPIEVRLAHPETQQGFVADIRYAIAATNNLLGVTALTYSPLITNKLSLLRSENTLLIVAHDHLLQAVDPQESVTALTIKSTINGLVGKKVWGRIGYDEGQRITVHGSRSSFNPSLPAQCSLAIYSMNGTIGHVRLLIAGYLNRIQVRRCAVQMLAFSAGVNLFAADFNEAQLTSALTSVEVPPSRTFSEIFASASIDEIRRTATAFAVPPSSRSQ